jgi:HD-GYP domain-containing protein (c-di-GMP phosphodiesterase class II)
MAGSALPLLTASGLSILRKGESLETVGSPVIQLRLLSSLPHMEIVEGTLSLGKRLTIVPPEEAGSELVEAWYILEGTLRSDLEGRRLEVNPGDCIIAQQLRDVTIFVAQTEVRFLYISTLPTFHEFSDTLAELKRLAVEVESKDGYTADHCKRLQRLSFATGKEMGLPHYRLYLLDSGAFLHDIGKVKVPVEILNKPSRLSAEEWAVIRQHPTFGREILEPTFMKASGPIVEQHHERMDGSGYPYGLAGDEILLESYIVAVADTYDAMTTDRAYRKALPPQEAFAEIRRLAGIHYPKEVVKAFFSAVKRVEP